MAGRAFQVAICCSARDIRLMGGTDRIVGTEASQIECHLQISFEVTAHFDQSAERSFRAGRRGVEQDSATTAADIDALTNRACRITAF